MEKEIVRELKNIVTQFRNGIVGRQRVKGRCYMVCAPLSTYLDLISFPNKLIEGNIYGDEHWWLKFEDGTICDPTASQFKKPDGSKMPKVFIGEKPKWYKQ